MPRLFHRITLLVLLGLMGGNGYGQVNLIPNGSFEQLDSCPSIPGNYDQFRFATGWFSPTNCTPDLFHECAFPTGWGVPTIVIGDTTYAFDGAGMARVYLYSSSGGREFISCQLSQTLDVGTRYSFSVSIKAWYWDMKKTGSIGALFTEDSITEFNNLCERIDLPPQLQRDPDSIINNYEIWYQWTDTLIASGYENFITIGNFRSNSETPLEGSNVGNATYLVDDLKLERISPDNVDEQKTTSLTLYPNPNTGTFTLDYSQLQQDATLRIRNTLSQILFEHQVDKGSTTLTQNIKLNKGIYLLELDDGNNCQHQYMVVTD